MPGTQLAVNPPATPCPLLLLLQSLKRAADASPVNDAGEAKRTKSASDEPGVAQADAVTNLAATKPNIFAAAVTKSGAGFGFGALFWVFSLN